MWKNYAVAATNILVSSIPLFATWDPIVGLCYCGIVILLLALLSWNIVGDYIVILFILHAREVSPNALITPSLQQYLRSLSNHELKNQRTPSLYYANSKVPYYIPVSAKNAVVSLALENRLQLDGERLLIKGCAEGCLHSKNHYKPEGGTSFSCKLCHCDSDYGTLGRLFRGGG